MRDVNGGPRAKRMRRALTYDERQLICRILSDVADAFVRDKLGDIRFHHNEYNAAIEIADLLEPRRFNDQPDSRRAIPQAVRQAKKTAQNTTAAEDLEEFLKSLGE